MHHSWCLLDVQPDGGAAHLWVHHHPLWHPHTAPDLPAQLLHARPLHRAVESAQRHLTPRPLTPLLHRQCSYSRFLTLHSMLSQCISIVDDIRRTSVSVVCLLRFCCPLVSAIRFRSVNFYIIDQCISCIAVSDDLY